MPYVLKYAHFVHIFALSKLHLIIKHPNMGLTHQALEAIKTDSDLRAKLMLVPDRKNGKGRSEFTIKRWVDANDDTLTMPKYVQVIAKHTGLSSKDILEKPVTV